MDASDTRVVAQVEAHVRQQMAGQQAGHDVDHVMRVFRSACEIQEEVGGDRLVVQLAALLHDLGDAKFHEGVERSGEFSQALLSDLRVPESIIQQVVFIVDNISFRKGVDRSTLSIEGQIVQDADRLDALGAIGIVRTIEYGAAFGQPFHLSENEGETQATGVGHFHEKLFKLRALLNTEPAKRIAREREKFMQTFLDQFLHEWG